MTGNYLPTNCGESTDVGGVYVCRLACVPCPLYYGKEARCEKDHTEEFLEAIAKIINKKETEE